MGLWLLLALWWPGTPKAPKPTNLHNLRVPIACLTKDVILHDCDLTAVPPKCGHAVVSYLTRCAIIEAKKEKKP